MKYFTKEWYEACQAADWCLNMAVSKNAEEFSEEYYKDLYTRRRRAFVKQMKEEEGEAFDKIAAEVAFMKHHEETVKRMERILPIEIKAAVADMRVLALDIATKEVRHQLKAWCEEQKKLADAKEAEYAADSTKESSETFAGCELAGVEMKETTLTLTLLSSGGKMAERGGLCCGGRQGIPYLAQKKQRYTWVSDDFCGAAYNFKIKTEKGGQTVRLIFIRS